MAMKIRVTVDLAQADESINEALGSIETGAFGCDKESAYRMWYHSRTDLISFEDVVELGEDEKGIDVVKLDNLQWINNDKTGVGYIMIGKKKYNFVLKEDENDSES